MKRKIFVEIDRSTTHRTPHNRKKNEKRRKKKVQKKTEYEEKHRIHTAAHSPYTIHTIQTIHTINGTINEEEVTKLLLLPTKLLVCTLSSLENHTVGASVVGYRILGPYILWCAIAYWHSRIENKPMGNRMYLSLFIYFNFHWFSICVSFSLRSVFSLVFGLCWSFVIVIACPFAPLFIHCLVFALITSLLLLLLLFKRMQSKQQVSKIHFRFEWTMKPFWVTFGPSGHHAGCMTLTCEVFFLLFNGSRAWTQDIGHKTFKFERFI